MKRRKGSRMTRPEADELPVGRIAGRFGVRGELKCDPTSAGRIVFSNGVVLRCERGQTSSQIWLTQVRAHQSRLIIRIEGVEDASAADEYVGSVLYAPRQDVALNDGEYLDADLVGCAVKGVDDVSYGTVERVEHYPGSDMLVVGGHLVPMVQAIVREIDLDRRLIAIDPPAGLFDP